MASSNPALIFKWAIATDAQRTRGAETDMYVMSRHFGLERVNYPSIPRYLSHMRSCKGMSSHTRVCAREVFDSLVTRNAYTYAYTCEHCTDPVPWDMTTEIGSLEQLYARFNVDISTRKRTRPLKRSRDEETEDDEEKKRERKRSRSEDEEGEILDLEECTVALVADVMEVVEDRILTKAQWSSMMALNDRH